MKKLVAIMICTAALLSLCSCKGKDGNKSDGSVVSDATYFDGTTTVKVDDSAALSALKEGKMSLQKSDDSGFVDVGLGMGVDEFKVLFPEGLYTETDRDGYDIYLPVGGQIFVDTAAPSNGAVAIAQYGDIFQFTSTITTKDQIKKIMGEAKFDGEYAEVSDKNLIYGSGGSSCLMYQIDENQLWFFFTADGVFQSTVMCKAGKFIFNI